MFDHIWLDIIEVKSFCICFLNSLFDWFLLLNLKCYVLISVEKFILLTSSHNPIYCKRLCHSADPTSSVVLPFLFKSVLPLALDACSYFALWETFSLVTVANLLPTSKRSVAILPSQTNGVHSPFLASSSPNYPSAMNHVRMYSSRHCQAGFQPVLFNWSSL